MSLQIEATVKTPKVLFDRTLGRIQIEGISIPEDPLEFYDPLEKELDEYVNNPCSDTLLEFKLEYFNTSSTLIIRNIVRKLHAIQDHTNLVVNWYYEAEDEDMEEAGHEFKKLFEEVSFNVVSVTNF